MQRFEQEFPVVDEIKRKHKLKSFSDVAKTILRYKFSIASQTNDADDIADFQIILAEYIWNNSGRPFVNAYGSVVESALNSRLEFSPSMIPFSILHRINAISIRIDSTVREKFNWLPRSFMLVIGKDIKICFEEDGLPSFDYSGIIVNYANDFSRCSRSIGWDRNITDTETENINTSVTARHSTIDFARVINSLLRIACCIAMLASDEKYIEPILLAADRHKKPTPELIDKAKRRGVFGFDVGRSIEISPHMRRPHFAIRWTGKGGKIPKLVPVSGSVVKRHKLLEVPTGYEGKEE